MAEPVIELTKRGSDSVAAFACGKCGCVVSSPVSHASSSEARAAARAHCCCIDCGAELGKATGNRCEPCWKRMHAAADERINAREAELFAKAKKVSFAEYGGEMFFDLSTRAGNDGYCTDLDDLDDAETRPQYVWACEKQPISVSVDDVVDAVIEHATEEHHESIQDLLDVDSLRKGLQPIVDAWVEAQTRAYSYFPDYSTAVLIPPAEDIDAEAGDMEPAPPVPIDLSGGERAARREGEVDG